MPKKFYGGRAMLNRPGHESTAAIVAEVRNTAGEPDDLDEHWVRTPEYQLQLSDCDRRVRYDLSFGDAECHRNNLHKVDTMIRLLTEFREGLAAETKLYNERKKAKERRRGR